MIPNRNSNSHERRLTPGLAERIQQRWGVVYYAVEDEHAVNLAVHQGLLAPDAPAPAPAAQAPVSSEVAGNVIDLAARQETRSLTEQEERLVKARQATEEAHNASAA